jgi:hypothetical protein
VHLADAFTRKYPGDSPIIFFSRPSFQFPDSNRRYFEYVLLDSRAQRQSSAVAISAPAIQDMSYRERFDQVFSRDPYLNTVFQKALEIILPRVVLGVLFDLMKEDKAQWNGSFSSDPFYWHCLHFSILPSYNLLQLFMSDNKAYHSIKNMSKSKILDAIELMAPPPYVKPMSYYPSVKDLFGGEHKVALSDEQKFSLQNFINQGTRSSVTFEIFNDSCDQNVTQKIVSKIGDVTEGRNSVFKELADAVSLVHETRILPRLFFEKLVKARQLVIQPMVDICHAFEARNPDQITTSTSQLEELLQPAKQKKLKLSSSIRKLPPVNCS